MDICNVPITVLSASDTFIHFICIATLWWRQYYDLHLTDEETEAYKV